MIDLLTYVQDLELFKLEVLEKIPDAGAETKHYFSVGDSGGITYNAAKIPVKYSDDGLSSVCMVRVKDRAHIDELESIEVIAEFNGSSYSFEPYGRDKYESVYNTQPVTYTDEDGNEHTFTPPYIMGVFA